MIEKFPNHDLMESLFPILTHVRIFSPALFLIFDTKFEFLPVFAEMTKISRLSVDNEKNVSIKPWPGHLSTLDYVQ